MRHASYFKHQTSFSSAAASSSLFIVHHLHHHLIIIIIITIISSASLSSPSLWSSSSSSSASSSFIIITIIIITIVIIILTNHDHDHDHDHHHHHDDDTFLGPCDHLLCLLHLPCEGFLHSHCQVAFLLLLSQYLDLSSHPRFKGLILRKLLYFLGETLRRSRGRWARRGQDRLRRMRQSLQHHLTRKQTLRKRMWTCHRHQSITQRKPRLWKPRGRLNPNHQLFPSRNPKSNLQQSLHPSLHPRQKRPVFVWNALMQKRKLSTNWHVNAGTPNGSAKAFLAILRTQQAARTKWSKANVPRMRASQQRPKKQRNQRARSLRSETLGQSKPSSSATLSKSSRGPRLDKRDADSQTMLGWCLTWGQSTSLERQALRWFEAWFFSIADRLQSNPI